jgi:excisionase family DNA binding protein
MGTRGYRPVTTVDREDFQRRRRAGREDRAAGVLPAAVERFVDQLAAELADLVERRLAERAAAEGPQALDVKQAAARLGIGERTMREMVRSGQVPSVKVGRRRLIAAAAIDRLLTR